MNHPQYIQHKIFSSKEIVFQVNRWKMISKTISFTNGCFDILHAGHIASLSDAAREADFLIVGLNSVPRSNRERLDCKTLNVHSSMVIDSEAAAWL